MFHQFTVSKSGEFEIKITALSNADAILLMVYGPESGGCTGVTLWQRVPAAEPDADSAA